jgi:hypothetical protein
MEQEPGPRGSPQLPHAPEGIAVADEEDAEPLAWTANTDIREASFLPWHFGQLAFSFPITKASNEWWQSLQVYSNRGICRFPHTYVSVEQFLTRLYSANPIPCIATECYLQLN